MTILVVDNNPDRLWQLVEDMRTAFPGAVIEYTHDPRMSNVSRTVDIVFATLNMKRMNGMSLASYIWEHNNPKAKAYLMADKDELDKWNGSQSGQVSRLAYPVTLENLREIAREEGAVITNK